MGTPFIIPGGENELGNGEAVVGTKESQGVFARFPGATPKYAINQGIRDNEYRETMARMFIQMGPKERDAFVKAIKRSSPETAALAEVLCGVGAGGSGGTGFIDFLLTSVQEPFQEKIQVVETLSDNFIVYCFGQAAPQFQYSGVLLNTYQDDQRVWMTRLYQDILRGTQLARRRKLVRLRYDSVIVSGIIVAMQQTLNGTEENSAQFAFTLIPMQYAIFTEAVGNPTLVKSSSTEGGKYNLRTIGIPKTNKIKTSATTSPLEPANPRANEQTENLRVTAANKRAAEDLSDRVSDRVGTVIGSPLKEPVKDVRGGVTAETGGTKRYR